MVSGIVGAAVALTQSPRGIALFQSPPVKTEPVSTIKPIQKAVTQQSRSQELTDQLEQSNAAQLLKQLSGQADAKVKDSKSAIEGFIQQKTNEQRDHLKQIVIDALREAMTGEATQQSKALPDEFKGIKLTTEQTAQIQKARREMQTEIVQQLQNNPQLMQQLQSDLQAGRLNQALSQPLNQYSDTIAQILTPQQQQKWQKNFDLLKSLSR
jgi:ribosomal protein L5